MKSVPEMTMLKNKIAEVNKGNHLYLPKLF